MAKNILADSCFWLGLIDPEDQHHEKLIIYSELIDNYSIIFPWPCLYETLSTRLSRRRNQLHYIERLIDKPNIFLFNDSDYRNKALEQVFLLNNRSGYSYSLTDCVIREILKDKSLMINYMITYNLNDFKDICDIRKIEIFFE